MTALRLVLIVLWTALLAFTAFVIGREGLDFLSPFFGAIAAGGWQGQFNADFLTFLVLSALWTGWRSGWNAGGTGLAVLAFFGGGGFLLPYLLILLHREKGDMARVLLGRHAAP